ncbi:type II toxin-antitoxin system VapC family toxin [Arthrobacter tecti]
MSRGFLLDTNVVSEGRKPQPDPAVESYLRSISDHNIYLSVLTIGELHKGISKLGEDPSRLLLKQWVRNLADQYAENILSVDKDIAVLWGQLSADRPRPMTDTLLAATALCHDLIVVTRNTTDFDDLPVDVFNPWNEG